MLQNAQKRCCVSFHKSQSDDIVHCKKVSAELHLVWFACSLVIVTVTLYLGLDEWTDDDGIGIDGEGDTHKFEELCCGENLLNKRKSKPVSLGFTC